MRKNYTQFPESYTKIVEHFKDSYSAIELVMDKRDALARRRDLYRFFEALGKNSATDHDAWKLYKLAKELTISVRQNEDGDDCVMVIKFNAITESMRLVDKLFDESEDIEERPKVREKDTNVETYDVDELERLIATRDKGDL